MMNVGKLPENILKRSVLGQIKVKNKEIITGAAFGEDCAILNCEKNAAVSQASGFGINGALRAVIKASNNIFASGFDFKFAEISIILGEEFEEESLKELVSELNKLVNELGASIIGGQTEVSKAIEKTSCLVSITAIGQGEAKKEKIKAGDSIVVSKWIGLEGAIDILKEKRAEISDNFGSSFPDYFDGYEDLLSIKKESIISKEIGCVLMKDVSEHGIFGGLWELGSRAGMGLKVDIKAIPVRQEIIEICNLLDISPYELKSSGMLITVTKEPDELIEALRKEGINAVKIGEFTDNNDRIIVNNEEVRFLEKIKTDSVYKI